MTARFLQILTISDKDNESKYDKPLEEASSQTASPEKVVGVAATVAVDPLNIIQNKENNESENVPVDETAPKQEAEKENSSKDSERDTLVESNRDIGSKNLAVLELTPAKEHGNDSVDAVPLVDTYKESYPKHVDNNKKKTNNDDEGCCVTTFYCCLDALDCTIM